MFKVSVLIVEYSKRPAALSVGGLGASRSPGPFGTLSCFLANPLSPALGPASIQKINGQLQAGSREEKNPDLTLSMCISVAGQDH